MTGRWGATFYPAHKTPRWLKRKPTRGLKPTRYGRLQYRARVQHKPGEWRCHLGHLECGRHG